MAIKLLKVSDRQPWVEVRFKLNYAKRGGKETRIHGFLFPYTDEDGIDVVEVFLSTAEDNTAALKRCYKTIMRRAVLYNFRTMIIPVFPDRVHTTLSRKQVLLAACLAYSEETSWKSLTVYLLDEEFTTEEEDILSIAEYVVQQYVEPGKLYARYSISSINPSDDNSAFPDDGDNRPRYSADDDSLFAEEIQYSKREELDSFEVSQTSRFDPTRGSFQMDAGFGETVLKLIQKKGMTEAQCYNKANISRAAFHKIRQSARTPESTYRPSKQTAMALAVALELSFEEAEDLLERAGYAFSHSNKGDIIVEYFLLHRNYNLFELNEVLFEFDQPLLGSV